MNQLDAEHQTALMWAAAFGHSTVVQGLIGREAKAGKTRFRFNQVVRLFDDSVNFMNFVMDGLLTPWPVSKPSLSRPLVLKRIFFFPFEVDLLCKGGKTALMIACTLGREAVVAEARLQPQNSDASLNVPNCSDQ